VAVAKATKEPAFPLRLALVVQSDFFKSFFNGSFGAVDASVLEGGACRSLLEGAPGVERSAGAVRVEFGDGGARGYILRMG
jgi:hypothetical protein